MDKDISHLLTRTLNSEVRRINPDVNLVSERIEESLEQIEPDKGLFFNPHMYRIDSGNPINTAVTIYGIMCNNQALSRRQERIWSARPGWKKLSCPVCAYLGNIVNLHPMERLILVDKHVINLLNSAKQPYSFYCEHVTWGNVMVHTPFLVVPGVESSVLDDWKDRNRYTI